MQTQSEFDTALKLFDTALENLMASKKLVRWSKIYAELSSKIARIVSK